MSVGGGGCEPEYTIRAVPKPGKTRLEFTLVAEFTGEH